MTKQNAVFFQIYVLPNQVDAVTEVLNSGGNPNPNDSFFAFNKIPDVHFARWIVVPANDKYGASLVYAANVDGTEEKHINDLVDKLPDGLDKILIHCKDYPEENNRTRATRLAYLMKHKQKTPGFYVGAPNRSVSQINNEVEMQRALQQFVQANGSQWKTSKEAYAAIKKHVAEDPDFAWAKEKYHLPRKRFVKMFFFVLLLLLILPLLAIYVVIIHFFYEKKAKPFGKNVNQIPPAHMAPLKAQEDKIYQNQLSQIFETKGGLRKVGLRFFLWFASFTSANWFVGGQLLGTPTIHFARWVFIDNGSRFVFFSNFDGSFDEYLGDFVDNSGWGLNAIYGASIGYPRTFYVFGKGAYEIAEFMGWGRLTQVPTPIWYSAYPWTGLQQIVSNSHLRASLFNSGNLSDKEIKEMLRRI